MAASIKVIGGSELRAALGNMLLGLRTAEANAAFRKGAGVIRDEARQQAPKKSGRLARAIISFASLKSGGRKGTPAGWARVNIFSGRVVARHGHLVEFGTKERRPKTKKRLAFMGLAGPVFARKVAGVKPNPYFARAIASKGQRALDVTVEGVRAVLLRAAGVAA